MRDPRCAACGTQDDLKYHHLVPHGMGGTDDETNLLTLCEGCQAKANGAWRYSDLTQAAREYGEALVTGLSTRGSNASHDAADRYVETLRPIIQSMIDAGTSYGKIARELYKLGIPTARGGVWSSAQAARVAQRLQRNQPTGGTDDHDHL